jgi:hypothetical protein
MYFNASVSSFTQKSRNDVPAKGGRVTDMYWYVVMNEAE